MVSYMYTCRKILNSRWGLMNKGGLNIKLAFKQNYLAYLLIGILFLINVIYVSIEIHKSKVAKLIPSSELTSLEFERLEAISHYALIFEFAFLILSIFWTLILFTKKYKPFFRTSILIQCCSLLLLFVFNYALAILFDAPTGNLTQLIVLPFMVVIGAVLYFFIRKSFSFFAKPKIHSYK